MPEPDVDEPFFTTVGDHVVAGPLCRGPWDAGSAHFGPPAALLGRAIEQVVGGEGKRVARLAFDVLSPVPLGPLRIETAVVRPGRRVDLVEATMVDLAADRPVALCRAWRQRRPDPALEVPSAGVSTEHAPPGPDDRDRMGLFLPQDVPGYHVGTQWRSSSGDPLSPGPAAAWCRMEHPLLDDEEPTALQRVLVAADSANGLSAVALPTELLFVNTDLTVHLERDPIGEWVALDAVTTIAPDGGGTATARLFDRTGAIGRATQSLFVSPPST